MTSTFPSIPNFEVVGELGKGGMGRVYLCRSQGAYGFKKLLAVKVINPERRDQEHVRAMFLDEAQLVAQLDHPAIAQVYDFQESDDALYLVMEYVAGVSLAQALIESIQLPPLICASMIAAVCRGLHAAHDAKDEDGRAMNVVHRDVTPSNLLVTFAGQMKILDFGIALMRQRRAPVTSVGRIRGKPTYLSPEQFAGETIDRRTDVYSVSIVLYEILTNEKLFTPDDYLGAPSHTAPANWKEVAANIKPPSEAIGALPAGLDEVVMKGLAVDPADRFPDAKAMAMALEAIVDRDGCETLEAFADREFASLREAHDRRVRSGSDVEADNPQTQDAEPPQLDFETEPAVAKTPIIEPTATSDIAEPATVVGPVALEPPRRSRAWMLVAGIAAALVIVVALMVAQTPEPIAVQPEIAAPPPRTPAAATTAVVVDPPPPPPPVAAPPPPPPPEPPLVAPVKTPKVRTKKRRARSRTVKPRPERRTSRTISPDGIMQEW